MEKPQIIKSLENELGVYSIITLRKFDEKQVEKLTHKKFQIIYSSAEMVDKKTYYKELVLETPQPFFLHLKKIEDEGWAFNIYYKPEKYKELIFFINQLEKN